MKKMIMSKYACVCLLVGCGNSVYVPPPMVSHDDWKAPSEDTEYKIEGKWHEGKTYDLTQHLKAMDPKTHDRLPPPNAKHDDDAH